MTLTPAFAPDAKSQWQELEPQLWELVLDELDELATYPPAILKTTIIRRDALHRTSAVSHYLFLRFIVDERTATLVGIYHLQSPNPPSA